MRGGAQTGRDHLARRPAHPHRPRRGGLGVHRTLDRTAQHLHRPPGPRDAPPDPAEPPDRRSARPARTRSGRACRIEAPFRELQDRSRNRPKEVMPPRRRRAQLWSPIPVAIISESDWAGESRLAGFAFDGDCGADALRAEAAAPSARDQLVEADEAHEAADESRDEDRGQAGELRLSTDDLEDHPRRELGVALTSRGSCPASRGAART